VTRAWLAVAALYLAAVVGMYWPMPAHMGTEIWGDRFDAWTTLWLIDHLAERLRTGDLTPATHQILFPIGYDLRSFGHVGVQLIGAAAVAAGIPLVAAYNLLLLAASWSSALAAHALGRELTGSHRAGLVAGAIFATSPYFYGEAGAGCVELVAAGLLPLHALALVRLVRRPTARRALAATLILASVGLFNWYYTLFAGMFAVAFAAWWALRCRRVDRGLVLLVLSLVVAAGLDLPLVEQARRETPTRPAISAELFRDAEVWQRSSELMNGRVPLSEITPDLLEEVDALQVFINSTPVRSLVRAQYVRNPLRSTPGALAMGVGLTALVLAGRRVVGWLVIAGGATVLTLGPFLNLDGDLRLTAWAAELRLPYFWAYTWVPFFSKAYRPYRIGVIALQCLAAAGAIGAATLLPRLPRRLAAGGIGALLVAAFSQPFWAGERPGLRPLFDARVPELYRELASAPEGGVIGVPLQYQPVTIGNARFQYFQSTHRHPTLNCNQLIRRPDLLAFRGYVLGNTFLSTLLDLSREPPPYTFEERDIDRLAEDGFRYVVLHRSVPDDTVQLAGDLAPADLLGQPAIEMLRSVLGAPVITSETGWVLPILPRGGTRTLTWSGEDVIDIRSPLDVRTYGLPAVLQPGSDLPLYEGTGRSLSLWAHPLTSTLTSVGRAESGGALGLRIRQGDAETVVPLALPAERWTWVEQSLPEGPVSVTLTAMGPGAGHAELTRIQVLR